MKTVTVRIPVAVYPDGEWVVCDTHNYLRKDNAIANLIRGSDDYHRSIVWITAEVPIPEPVEVEGKVE